MLKQRRFPTLAVASLVTVGTLLLASCGGSSDAGGVKGDGGAEKADTAADSSGGARETGTERVIHIHAEKVKFRPSEIEVKVGEVVRLVLDNHDPVLHDYTVDEPRFVVLDSEGGAVHDMGGHTEGDAVDEGAMAHSESGDAPLVSATPLHIAAQGSTHADLVFRATKPGTYVFYCSVPGHRQAGMEGLIRVTE
ncbi:Plastocyanin [bacterium HR29]|nr:Plastocyanin [bacterium HR29]